MKVILSIFAILLAVSCGKPDQTNYHTKDIGLIDSSANTKEVIYADEEFVFLKSCNKDAKLPLTRSCRGKVTYRLGLQEYLNLLPYDTGHYPKTDAGLDTLTEVIAQVRADAEQGNEEARRRLRTLLSYEKNLRHILQIKSELQQNHAGESYLDYDEEFQILRQPFQLEKRPARDLQELMQWHAEGAVPPADMFHPDLEYFNKFGFFAHSPRDAKQLDDKLMTILSDGEIYIRSAFTREDLEEAFAEGRIKPYDTETGVSVTHSNNCDNTWTHRMVIKFGERMLISANHVSGSACAVPHGLRYAGIFSASKS